MKDAIVIDKKLIEGGYIELRGMKLRGNIRIKHAKRKTPNIFIVENFGAYIIENKKKNELIFGGLKKKRGLHDNMEP